MLTVEWIIPFLVQLVWSVLTWPLRKLRRATGIGNNFHTLKLACAIVARVGCAGVEGGVAWNGQELNGVEWRGCGINWSGVVWGRLEWSGKEGIKNIDFSSDVLNII